jgi:hypothetical protein
VHKKSERNCNVQLLFFNRTLSCAVTDETKRNIHCKILKAPTRFIYAVINKNNARNFYFATFNFFNYGHPSETTARLNYSTSQLFCPVRSSNPGVGKIFSLLRNPHPSSLLHCRLHSSFLGPKQPGHEADHPLQSAVEVKNGYSYKSTPLPVPALACYGTTFTFKSILMAE